MFESMLRTDPHQTLDSLFKLYAPTKSRWAAEDKLSYKEQEILDMLMDKDHMSLVEYAEHSLHAPTKMAEVIAYYVDWMPLLDEEAVTAAEAFEAANDEDDAAPQAHATH
jgi:hypothetical protein